MKIKTYLAVYFSMMIGGVIWLVLLCWREGNFHTWDWNYSTKEWGAGIISLVGSCLIILDLITRKRIKKKNVWQKIKLDNENPQRKNWDNFLYASFTPIQFNVYNTFGFHIRICDILLQWNFPWSASLFALEVRGLLKDIYSVEFLFCTLRFWYSDQRKRIYFNIPFFVSLLWEKREGKWIFENLKRGVKLAA